MANARERSLPKKLALLAAGLTAIHLAGQFSKFVLGHDHLLGLIPLFDLDNEGNVPTVFSSACLLLCSFMLVRITQMKVLRREAFTLHWAALSALFLFMAVDELVGIHEASTAGLRGLFGAGGIFHFAWIVPVVLLLPAFALGYLRFLKALPRSYLLQFLGAAAIYLGGAIGAEMLGGRHAALYGPYSPGYSLLATGEEILEMAGAIYFLAALTRYQMRHCSRIRVPAIHFFTPLKEDPLTPGFSERRVRGHR